LTFFKFLGGIYSFLEKTDTSALFLIIAQQSKKFNFMTTANFA